jgi:hypothetical protein
MSVPPHPIMAAAAEGRELAAAAWLGHSFDLPLRLSFGRDKQIHQSRS